MPKIETPDPKAQKIMQENGLDVSKFCVIHQGEDMIVLRNYKTRDDVTIHKGDRPW